MPDTSLTEEHREEIRQRLYRIVDYSVRMDSKSRGNAHSWAVFSLDHFEQYEGETFIQFLITLEKVEKKIEVYEADYVKHEIRDDNWFREQTGRD